MRIKILKVHTESIHDTYDYEQSNYLIDQSTEWEEVSQAECLELCALAEKSNAAFGSIKYHIVQEMHAKQLRMDLAHVVEQMRLEAAKVEERKRLEAERRRLAAEKQQQTEMERKRKQLEKLKRELGEIG